MTEYTPTVDEVRGAYAKWIADPEWFDRMIAAVERAAAVKALREAARAAEAFADKAIEQRDDSDYPESHYGNRLDGVAWGSYQVAVSLHDRADRIESGEQA
jgi:hypothetical protein